MKTIKSFEDLKELVESGKYTNRAEFPRKTEDLKEGYITDENMSVKWNREQVENNKKEYNKKIDEYHKQGNEKHIAFQNDIINLIKEKYGYTQDTAERIFNAAWDEGHSEGIYQVVYEAEKIVDFVSDLIYNETHKTSQNA